MIHVSDIQNLQLLTIHKVGNISNNEPLICSKECLNLEDENICQLLISYFINPFSNNAEYFQFYNNADINLNDIFVFASKIFEDKSSFHEQSINIAKHLYEVSQHPKIKSGELYIVYFDSCLVDGEEIEAIGIFKSESKDTYLKVFLDNESYNLNSDDGININKLDKGCLIFNTNKDDGYKVSIIDSVSKINEAIYWKDDFLKVKRINDNYLKTEQIVSFCNTFINEQLPQKFEVSKADRIDLINKSVSYFKEKENFSLDDFADNVIEQSAVIDSFKEFKQQYETDHDINISEEFEISDKAFKKQAKTMKSILKLDKNFHVYIHGRADLIEKGFDEEKNMNFYKLYFKEEE